MSQERDKSYGFPLFIAAALLGASLVWSIYDESVARRPWKAYQERFNDLEVEKVEEELAVARKVASSPKVSKAKERLAQLKREYQETVNTPEFKSKVSALAERQEQVEESLNQFQFSKGLTDEAYYNYQHTRDAGGEFQEKKQKWMTLLEASSARESEFKRLLEERDAIKSDIAGYRSEILAAEKELRGYSREVSRLEEKLGVLSKKSPQIRQIVVRDFARNGFGEPSLTVDRCVSCHMATDREGFEGLPQPFRTHSNFELFMERHSPEKYACTSCHDGQGSGLSFYDAGHSPKDEQQREAWVRDYDWKPIGHWDKPMLNGDFMQASCRRCHPLEEDIQGVTVLSEGINLFRETLGCVNCHLVKGFEDVNKIGPNLSDIGHKVNPEWLFKWIKDPRWHHEKSRMPNFKLTDDEAVSTVAFLMSRVEDREWQTHELRDGVLANPDFIAKGKALSKEIGCNGCHTIADTQVYENSQRDLAPSLTNIANKTSPTWILNWIMAPTAYQPKALMPDLRLSIDEAEAIVAYLDSLGGPKAEVPTDLAEKLRDKDQIASGLKVIADYGCYGCHDIPGTEKFGRVGAELTSFGKKEAFELAFGYASDVERSWLGFTRAKLGTPRIFETEIVEQRMPDFNLSDREIHALSVLLKGFRDETIPDEFTKRVSSTYVHIQNGRKLIKKYNCIGCHEIESGWGKENMLVSLKERYEEIDASNYGAPPLMGEGAKVQSEWLFRFIHEPSDIRPWLGIRMPTFNFNDEEVSTIVKYFQSVSEEGILYHYWRKIEHSEEEEKEMKGLFELLQCIKCHQFGADTGEAVAVAELAPDLSLTKDRLKPSWVRSWLRNPQGVEPGTKMPNFFVDIDEEYDDVTELLPEPEAKMEMITNYLYSME